MNIFWVFAIIGIVEFIIVLYCLKYKSRSKQQLKELKLDKEAHGIWRDWTGSRYVDRANPNPTKQTDMAAIIKVNPVTGEWESLS